MSSLQSHVLCALVENPLVRGLLARRNHHWTDPHEVVREQVERATATMALAAGVGVLPLAGADVRGEWVVPDGAPRDRVLLYFHGGGYVIGSCRSSRHLISKIVKASGMAALSVEYRLAPEHPFPAALEDAVAAYQYLLGQGYAPANIGLVGDSAGGALALAAMHHMRERQLPFPAAAVCLSPPTDFCGTGESMVTRAHIDPLSPRPAWDYFQRLYVGAHDPAHPLISPLYGDFHGFPPLMIHAGDHELLRDDALRVGAKARAAGVEVVCKAWPRMWHVFPALAGILPEARAALAELGAFLDARVARLKVLS